MAMSNKLTGIVTKGIGGFYYVEVADAIYTCKARGSFRKEGITPLAGDRVEITVQPDGSGVLDAVLPRRNQLVRPPIANLDCLVIVVSMTEPAPNLQVIDKLIAIAEDKDIEPVLVFNKIDLKDGEQLAATYRKAGFDCFTVSAKEPETVEPLRCRLQGLTAAFTGNSGVGKSSILNVLEPSLQQETGEISQKLGRGRHTTRSATLFRIGSGYLVDTPGFSSLDMELVGDTLRRDQLFYCFREFQPYFGKCRFSSCAHLKEPGCAVRAAVDEGEIAVSRYESYVSLYEQLKDQKDW